MDLLFPSQTFLGKDVDTIGIWLSGGADSALLCYLLVKHIKENKLKTQIQTLTVQKRPNEYFDIQQRVSHLLDAHAIFKNPIVYTVNDWIGDYYNTFHYKNIENVKNNLYSYIYSGITQTPDPQIYETLNWKTVAEIENVRNEDVKKLKVILGVFEENKIIYEFGEIRPFFHIDKLGVAKLYKDNDLLETLFPYTKSCEDRNVLDGHCGKCWFCQERLWAFGKL